MGKLACMGELLIDFQAKGCGELKAATEFVKKAGGAPANVCVQAAKLGYPAEYVSQVGDDAFGEFLKQAIAAAGVNVEHVKTTADYDTSLAFVSVGQNGERRFAFYRRTAADLYLDARDFYDIMFGDGDAFEFGSVALKTEQARAAHDSLIERARRGGALVFFDPNLRFNLWDSADELKRIALEYAAKADVVKVDDDEAEFLTGEHNIDGAAKKLLCGTVKAVAVTRGANGAKLYLADGRTFDCGGYNVNTVDTTGAGDSFFGGLIAELLRLGATPYNIVGNLDYSQILEFACKCGAYTTTGFGAIPSMGDRQAVSLVGEKC